MKAKKPRRIIHSLPQPLVPCLCLVQLHLSSSSWSAALSFGKAMNRDTPPIPITATSSLLLTILNHLNTSTPRRSTMHRGRNKGTTRCSRSWGIILSSCSKGTTTNNNSNGSHTTSSIPNNQRSWLHNTVRKLQVPPLRPVMIPTTLIPSTDYHETTSSSTRKWSRSLRRLLPQ